jgi:hypothetical protein
VLLILATLGAGPLIVWRTHRAPADAPGQASLRAREDGRFRCDHLVPTGHEDRYDAVRDPRGIANLIERHRDVAAVCRRALEQDQHVVSLDVLRARSAVEIRSLRALGCL